MSVYQGRQQEVLQKGIFRGHEDYIMSRNFVLELYSKYLYNILEAMARLTHYSMRISL